MNKTLVAVTHGRGLFKIDVDGTSTPPAKNLWGFAWALPIETFREVSMESGTQTIPDGGIGDRQ